MNRLGIGLRELLRYGYAGVLCLAIAALVDRAWVTTLTRDLGAVLSPLVVLALGAILHIVAKTLLQDWFLWRFVHWWHRDRTRCKIHYLEDECGVKRWRGHEAYALVRDTLMDDVLRERFHLQHSEGHLLFLTAFVCGIAALLGFVGVLPNTIPCSVYASLLAIALVASVAAVRQDITLCRAECAEIRTLGLILENSALRKKLQDAQFLKEPEEKKPAQGEKKAAPKKKTPKKKTAAKQEARKEPEPENLRAALAENWTHARHQEHQREFFARLYVVLVVAAFAFFKGDFEGAMYLPAFLVVLGCLGLLFTRKTNQAFDLRMDAIEKIRKALHLEEDFMPLRVVRSEGKDGPGIDEFLRVRNQYRLFYFTIILLCLSPYFVRVLCWLASEVLGCACAGDLDR